jgi:hypothetical protein
MSESLVQDISRNAQPLLELVEAGNAQEDVTQDQHRPPLADHFEALRDGAMHLGEAFAFHVKQASQLRDRTQLS